MNRAQIVEIQKRIGTTPDGVWGPKSKAACIAHLKSLMPTPNNWPTQDEAALSAYYGAAGDESQLVNLPVAGLGLFYDGQPVKTVRIHRKCSESLLRVLIHIPKNSRWVLTEYAGTYNNRAMRGGTRPSLHARGAAIDLAAATNGNRTAWPTGSTMPLEVMEAFAREGWLSAGAFWGRDGMHFQATR